jgi:hypothetical protein
MRVERNRTKKLIVAFRFHASDRAGWKCDVCRAQGLEERRRCGWNGRLRGRSERVVWADGDYYTTECPKSWITAESIALIEEYHVWKQLRCGDLRTLSARQAEAFLLIENEVARFRRLRASLSSADSNNQKVGDCRWGRHG